MTKGKNMDLLEQIGLSKEEIQDRVIENLCARVADDNYMSSRLEKEVRARIDQAVTNLGEATVLPRITEIIEGIVLQETNQWGEKRGKPLSFIEYLVQRADAFMREDVDFSGKAKSESDGYSWRKSTTRIAYMVNKHLQYSIETAMKEAMSRANASIAGGIEAAVKIKIQEVLEEMNAKGKRA